MPSHDDHQGCGCGSPNRLSCCDLPPDARRERVDGMELVLGTMALVGIASVVAKGWRGSRAMVEPDWTTPFGGERQTPHQRVAKRLTKRLGPNVGLNGDWSVSAWHLGPGSEPNQVSGDWYVMDNEDETYSIARRWYVGDDGGYQGLPNQYRKQADGFEDAVVEIATFSDAPHYISLYRWLDDNFRNI